MTKHVVVCVEAFVPKSHLFFLVLNTFNGGSVGWLPRRMQTWNPKVNNGPDILWLIPDCLQVFTHMFLPWKASFDLELWPSPLNTYDSPPLFLFFSFLSFFDYKENRTRHFHPTLRSLCINTVLILY